eukprot:Phypoly_transcript_17154.p1 GENE.Phypoly_transcript_17154~~Phypoly_transcript_17154.p1  ORF type:complete len:263 (+),score=33.16 Phypoly_transcript_17154:56-790(+)
MKALLLVILAALCVAYATRFQATLNDQLPFDHCFPYTTCESCINQTYCGWCSSPVLGGNGAQCAGFSPTNGSTPFICFGTYQTTTCILPTTAVATSASTTQTTTSTSTGTSGSTGSTSTTGYNPVPPVEGFWRGLQINAGYVIGEWNFTFVDDNVTIEGPNAISFSGNILSNVNQMNLVVTAGDGKGATYNGIFELDYGPASVFLTWALAPLGTTVAPSDWGVAMKSPNYRVWAMEQPKSFFKW